MYELPSCEDQAALGGATGRGRLIHKVLPKNRGHIHGGTVDLEQPADDDELSRYADYPLVRDMLKYEQIRDA